MASARQRDRIGTAMRRLEDDALLRGEGRFLDDLILPDML